MRRIFETEEQYIIPRENGEEIRVQSQVPSMLYQDPFAEIRLVRTLSRGSSEPDYAVCISEKGYKQTSYCPDGPVLRQRIFTPSYEANPELSDPAFNDLISWLTTIKPVEP